MANVSEVNESVFFCSVDDFRFVLHKLIAHIYSAIVDFCYAATTLLLSSLRMGYRDFHVGYF